MDHRHRREFVKKLKENGLNFYDNFDHVKIYFFYLHINLYFYFYYYYLSFYYEKSVEGYYYFHYFVHFLLKWFDLFDVGLARHLFLMMIFLIKILEKVVVLILAFVFFALVQQQFVHVYDMLKNKNNNTVSYNNLFFFFWRGGSYPRWFRQIVKFGCTEGNLGDPEIDSPPPPFLILSFQLLSQRFALEIGLKMSLKKIKWFFRLSERILWTFLIFPMALLYIPKIVLTLKNKTLVSWHK